MSQILKTAVWVLPVVVACAVVAGVGVGTDGALGALVGGAIVCFFFASSPLALGPITKVSPQLSLVAAMMFFVTKVVALFVLFAVLQDSRSVRDHVDAKSLGVSVIVTTLAWTVFQIRTATRQRLPAYDLRNARE